MLDNLSEIAEPYISQLLDISEEETQDLLSGKQTLSTVQVDKLASLFNVSEADVINDNVPEDNAKPLEQFEPRNVKTYARIAKIAKNSKEMKDLIKNNDIGKDDND